MLFLSLGFTLIVLFGLKFSNYKKINKSFRLDDFIRSVLLFPELKYFVNYSQRERKNIQRNNLLNFLILVNILLLVSLALREIIA